MGLKRLHLQVIPKAEVRVNKIKQFLFFLYLAALVLLGAFVLKHSVEAGLIRKMQVSPNKSGIVKLSLGRQTVISFLSRPEKVVPGSPSALEVNFIGKDVLLRPLSAHPGNLIVYTKSERIVILLQVGTESNYDDAVEVLPGRSTTKINLMKDTYK
jgi:hypothetical protein